MKILFFDTETSGLPKNYKARTEDVDNWPRLVQLAYIFDDTNKGPVEHNVIIKPEGFVIPKDASDLHGITQKMALEEGIELKYVLPAFFSAVSQADLIVGHNISFDANVVGAEFVRFYKINHLQNKRKICTMMESTSYCKIPTTNGYGGWKWPKLEELHQCLFGVGFEGAHDALNDIRATRKCYYELKRLGVVDKPIGLVPQVPIKEEKPMKIIELHGENVKRIKAVRFKPNAGVTIISGANENGKSSVLDVIWFALKGAEASKENPKPLRTGEEKGVAELDLGEYRVVRKFTENGSTLDVFNKDGAKFPSPQALLDKLIGSISLDPLAFLNYDNDKQRKLMLSFTNLTAALSKKDVEIKNVYDDRALVNRQLEKEAAVLTQYEQADVPEEVIENPERIVVDSLRKNLQLAIESNKSFYAQQQRRNELNNTIASLEKSIEDVKKKLAVEMKTPTIFEEDVSKISEELDEAVKRNAYVDILEQFNKQQEVCEGMHNRSTELTEKLELLRKERMDAIKNATYPLKGLGLDDNGVTFNDIPFIQLSGAEKLKVSVAMAIALQPKLKVIRITDGSLLDSNSMRVLEEISEKEDYQILIERVDESGKVGIVITDGEISANNYEKPIKKKVK